jgi:general secretion pathway protein D
MNGGGFNANNFMQTKQLFLALAVMLGLSISAMAQFPGGFGGFGGGNQNRQGNTGTSSTRQYENSTTVGGATISSDPETGRIIVITDEETSLHISQVISNLDVPKPQVLIKVVFLEVTYNNSSDIGIEGGFRSKTVGEGSGQGTMSGGNIFGVSGLNSIATNLQVNSLGLPVSAIGTTPPGAGLYQILGTDYEATLRAIAQAGKTEVLSRPSILARNNQPATITVGQSVPLITNVRYDNFGNAINSVSYEDVGIILRVTPFISNDGLVEMIVSPEISSLTDQTVPIANGVSVPVIAKRAADTVVVTPNGQPVIIGGMMQNTKTGTDNKIPFLGDIPLIGNLFKRQFKSNSKTELLIFLTPHIVEAPSQLLALSERERAAAVLPKKAFTEKDMNQFLNELPNSSGAQNGK